MDIFGFPPNIARWLIAFILTLAIELPVYLLLGRKSAPPWLCVAGGAAGTLVTHPLLWFVWRYTFDNYLIRTISGEILVCVIEGAILWAVARPVRFHRALAISLFANGASYGAGILLNLLGIF